MDSLLNIAFRRAQRFGIVLAVPFAAALGVGALSATAATAAAQSTSVDSLAHILLTGNFGPRGEALARILEDYPTSFPAPIRQAVVTLTLREASLTDPPTGEDYGEYIIDLCVAAVRTGDRSLVRPLVTLGGLGISSGIASFVVAEGPTILPLLDSVAVATPLQAEDVLDAYSLMLARHGATVSPADSTALLSRIFGAASSPDPILRAHLAQVAIDAPFPELVPLLQQFAATDTARLMPEGIFYVREDATNAVTKLLPVWNALTKAQLASALKREQVAGCATAAGATFGHCQTMRAQLDDLAQHLDQANTDPARNAVKNFLGALDKAARGLTAELVALMRANADRVTQLLGP